MAVNAPAIWGTIPQRNKNFTGRTELLDDLRKIRGLRVLQGLGGVGKSAVAAEYAYRYADDYDLVWWVASADHPESVRASLAALAVPLRLPEAVSAGIEGAAAAVLDALRLGDPYPRWLLIFDNADQPEELNQIIPRGPGDVLVTTRNHRWQGVADTISVDVFDREESVEFLTERAPKSVTSTVADQLAGELGDLPLALEQAGALIAETGMPAAEYMVLLEENITRIMAEGGSAEYPLSMTAAWRLSVEKLRLPQAQELLRCCAFFGPDPIPRDLFRRGAHAPVSSALSDLLVNPILLAQAIRELARLALIKIDGRGVVVHRLIQALIRDELDPVEQGGYRNDVHAILVASSPPDPSDLRQWPAYAELVGHVGSDVVDLAGCGVSEHRTAPLAMLRYLYLSGDLASCRSFASRFIDGWADESDSAVLEAQRHLGNVLTQLGKYLEAYELTDETLRTATRELGPRDRLTLALRILLGADHRALGDFRAARELDAETSDLHAEVFGRDDPQTLRVLSNLALDYVLNSDYQAARDLYQRVFLRQSESASGVSAIEILSTWSSLAWDVRLCGDYRGARDVSEDAWDYGKERLGQEHYQTLRSANALAIALRYLGGPLLADAAALAGQTLDQCGRLYGQGHPDTLATALNLASILRAAGSADEALRLGSATVARYPSVYGDDHPYHYGCIGNLAVLRQATGDLDGARQLNESALAGLDRRLGRDHHYSLTVAANLASTLAALGDDSGARALGEDTLARLSALLGADHPMTLGCAANLEGDGPAHVFDFDPPAI
ncbi:MAG: FxSxx-COOH system tetratricopeptide repeat protein [Streptosporangiaceae bacterium]